MASPPQLTPAQIDEFKAEGYVIARGLIPVAVVDDWRRQVWEATTADPSWWPEGDYRGPFVGKELIASGTGMRNAAILRPELQDRLRYPYPSARSPRHPRPTPPHPTPLCPLYPPLFAGPQSSPDVRSAAAGARTTRTSRTPTPSAPPSANN